VGLTFLEKIEMRGINSKNILITRCSQGRCKVVVHSSSHGKSINRGEMERLPCSQAIPAGARVLAVREVLRT